MYANRVLVKTVEQQNPKGKFFNYKIEPIADSFAASLLHPVDHSDSLHAGKDFRAMVMAGEAKAADETSTVDREDDAAVTHVQTGRGEIP